MKPFGRDGLDAGPRRLRAEHRRGASRPGRARLLALLAPPSPEAVRVAGFSGARQRDFEDFVSGGIAAEGIGAVRGEVPADSSGDCPGRSSAESSGRNSGELGWAAMVLRPLPDPGFREGLRRRLWRIHLARRSDRGFGRH